MIIPQFLFLNGFYLPCTEHQRTNECTPSRVLFGAQLAYWQLAGVSCFYFIFPLICQPLTLIQTPFIPVPLLLTTQNWYLHSRPDTTLTSFQSVSASFNVPHPLSLIHPPRETSLISSRRLVHPLPLYDIRTTINPSIPHRSPTSAIRASLTLPFHPSTKHRQTTVIPSLKAPLP